MRIGFFGTPEIAAFCLKGLSEKHEIVFVVTGEDKEIGRNRKIKLNPVKVLALEIGTEILQPQSLKNKDFFDSIKNSDVDIFVVVAYGKIIPKNIFEIPKFKTINLHPSKLPKYRGAAPIQTALIDGLTETGITVQLINEKMDAGDIVLQKSIELNSEMTSVDLYDIVLPVGVKMLMEAIDLFESGNLSLIKQNDEDVTYCSKIDRDTAQIDWSLPAIYIHNLVRGLNPKPVAWSTFRDANIKIWKTVIPDDIEDLSLEIGVVTKYQKKRLLVGTGDGLLEILRIQPQTKKEMDATSFINGSRLEVGEHFKIIDKNN